MNEITVYISLLERAIAQKGGFSVNGEGTFAPSKDYQWAIELVDANLLKCEPPKEHEQGTAYQEAVHITGITYTGRIELARLKGELARLNAEQLRLQKENGKLGWFYRHEELLIKSVLGILALQVLGDLLVHWVTR